MNDHELKDTIVAHFRHYAPILAEPRVRWVDVAHKIQGSVNRYRAIIRAIENHAPQPGQALEVGVGHGIPLLLYARLFPELIWHGVDAPWTSIEHPDFRPFLPRIRTCDLECDDMPFEPNTFHCAIFSEVAEHIPPPAFAHALTQIHRVLAPGGVLIATSPNLVSLMNRLIFLVGCSPFHLPLRSEKYGGGYPHIHLYSGREVAALGRRLGYEVVSIGYHTYLTYALIQNNSWRNAVLRLYLAAETIAGLIRPTLRDGWVAVLRKPLQPTDIKGSGN